MEPRILETPSEAIRETVREMVAIDKRTFIIEKPTSLDQLFHHPAVCSTYAAHDYIPYWADLWPASQMLAEVILREAWEKRTTRDTKLHALEIGCGLGLSGVVALARGLRVTFSDCDQLAIRFATNNARLNGFSDFQTAAYDVASPPVDVRYPVIIGSDVMYEQQIAEPLAMFIRTVLEPGGLCLIADPDRVSARGFPWLAEQAGLSVHKRIIKVGEHGSKTRGTIYRIEHAT